MDNGDPGCQGAGLGNQQQQQHTAALRAPKLSARSALIARSRCDCATCCMHPVYGSPAARLDFHRRRFPGASACDTGSRRPGASP